MPDALTISIDADAALAAIGRTVDPRGVVSVAARGVAESMRRHLLRRNAEPPKRAGWPKSNYWAQAARSVYVKSVEERSATIAVDAPGLAMKRTGGVIRPKDARALAIPARPEVAFKWPSEVTGQARERRFAHRKGQGGGGASNALFCWWPKGRASGALAKREQGGHLRIYWWLVKKSTVKPDPNVLPQDDAIADAARRAVSSLIAARSAGKEPTA